MQEITLILERNQIAYFYPQIDHTEAPEENINTIIRCLEKFGAYDAIADHRWSYPIADKWNIKEVPPLPPTKL